MMQISSRRATSPGIAWSWLLWLLVAMPVRAERVMELYAATVPIADDSVAARDTAFAVALGEVLMRMTGRIADAQMRVAVGDPAARIQQFRRAGSGELWVRFDGAALRRALDAAQVPVWGEERPLTALWFIDERDAQRPAVLTTAPEGAPDPLADVRRVVLAAATASAVPVVLPSSGDALARQWDAAADPVAASRRYQAQAVLLGRLTGDRLRGDEVDWLMVIGDEREQWRGTVADGPRGLAARLAQRFAVLAGGASQVLRLRVEGVETPEQYGLLLGYLRRLDIIESVGVLEAGSAGLIFEVRLRGSPEHLARDLALRGPLVAVDGTSGGDSAWHYRIGAGF
jgi:hypothetical protein